MDVSTKKALYEYLTDFVSENKRKKFDEIIRYRTRYLTVVLEDIYQPHNASAVLRSCDCFGVQDVHIIENQNTYQVNPDVALGSSKWLTLIKYNGTGNNSVTAAELLRKRGYRIIATTPHKDDVDLQELSLEAGPVALCFGTEMRGLSKNMLDLADAYMKIPMFGFTESFNISVSVAISLFHLTGKLRNSSINWQLPEEEILDIQLQWARQVIKRSDLLEEAFFKSNH